MKKFNLCILLLCILNSKVSAEELTWGSCTTYAPYPVLFIHGINANSLTWDTATKELEKYFGYRWVQFNKPTEPITKEKPAVTYDETKPDAPQNKVVKHYLEAFDYGGEDKKGSFYHIGSNYGSITTRVEDILKAYYGDDWYKNPNAKILIIAHSQGGLVARDYIQKKVGEGEDPKVKRLVTIGTPHLGSGLATVAKVTATNIQLNTGIPDSEFEP
ncbi:MAG: hypothetical protein AB1414_18375 [bacterium]